ncbi:MAG: MFS transporter, partial [Spirochaetes bacterium]|nr:MFS transporter [Spirochaetota bacterium]
MANNSILKKIDLLKIFHTYSGLPRSIYILFFARIVNRMGDFVHMFLTLYLTQRMGYDKIVAAQFVMLVSGSRMLGAMFSGRFGDSMGRKKIMLAFQLLFILCLIPCGFLKESMSVPWLLVIAGFFNGAERPMNSAMVTDLTEGEERKRAFSLVYLGINIGVAVGPLIAGFLFKNHIQWI